MTATSNSVAHTILGHEAQILAEKMVLQLLQDKDVVALQDRLKAELATTPRGCAGDGAVEAVQGDRAPVAPIYRAVNNRHAALADRLL